MMITERIRRLSNREIAASVREAIAAGGSCYLERSGRGQRVYDARTQLGKLNLRLLPVGTWFHGWTRFRAWSTPPPGSRIIIRYDATRSVRLDV